jgi:hypothetical protein
VEFVMRGHAAILAAILAWFISIESAEAKLDILVDKATQRMLVIQDGYIRYMWPVSTGRDNMQTPNGVYTPQRLERNWFSSAYYDSPMPFSIFFHNGYAIHGSYAIDRLGGPASHGCVRLHPHHAAILFDLVQQEGPDRTTIEIADQGRPADPSLPRREIAAGPGVNPPVPRTVNYGDTGDMPDPPPVQRGNRLLAVKNALASRPVPATDEGRFEEPPLPRLEIAGGPGVNPPVPRKVPYRATGDMPNLPPAQRGIRIAAKNPLLLRPAQPADRRLLADVRPPSNAPRAPYGAGEANTANGSPRPSNESSDYRPQSKVAEGSPPEQAPSNRGFKLLPASCWSGSASRWQWWASSQGTPCK